MLIGFIKIKLFFTVRIEKHHRDGERTVGFIQPCAAGVAYTPHDTCWGELRLPRAIRGMGLRRCSTPVALGPLHPNQ